MQMYTDEQSLDQVQAEQRSFMAKVYGWMASALGVTAFISFFTASSPALLKLIIGNPILFFGLIIAELMMVGYLAGAINRISAKSASWIFFGYAALNGLTLSFIFVAYTSTSIATAFFVTAGMFAVMSIYGYTTKKDLTSMGGFMIMGLFGIIIASVVNLFLRSSTLYWMITYIGVLIFVGLTAYDTQKIKNMNIIGNEGTDEDRKEAILGALKLYLDFINLFLLMLRILGGRRGSWR
ncbi:Bax inhibitor-1/YccA family protein [bacterium]